MTAALIAPPLALAASDGVTGGTPAPAPQLPAAPVAPSVPGPQPAAPAPRPPDPPATGGAPAPAPAPPVPELRPTERLVEAAAQPRAVASQEAEAPGEVPNLQKFGKSKPRGGAPAQAAPATAGGLPHTGYVPLAMAMLGLAMLAAGASTFLLAPRR